MYEPAPLDTKSAVIVPMDMSVAERVLKEAKAVLDDFGVVFFLRHGTCLGAVRDQQMLPVPCVKPLSPDRRGDDWAL